MLWNLSPVAIVVPRLTKGIVPWAIYCVMRVSAIASSVTNVIELLHWPNESVNGRRHRRERRSQSALNLEYSWDFNYGFQQLKCPVLSVIFRSHAKFTMPDYNLFLKIKSNWKDNDDRNFFNKRHFWESFEN